MHFDNAALIICCSSYCVIQIRPNVLDLSGTSVSDLTPLQGLTSLQTLNLYAATSVSDLTPLQGLTSLQTLDLTGTEVTDLAPAGRPHQHCRRSTSPSPRSAA